MPETPRDIPTGTAASDTLTGTAAGDTPTSTAAGDIPTILIVFGATGDLMQRKVTPALFHLFEEGLLPPHFRVVGYGRRELTDEQFRAHVTAILAADREAGADDASYASFLELFEWRHGQFDEADGYAGLGERLVEIDVEWGVCANKLFYLAVPPEHYRTIFGHLSGSGLTRGCGPNEGWTRVLVEKPFGRDARTAQELDELLGSLFREEQIYRIDHYLAKEMLQGILNFRFSNNLLEPSWDAGTIERIDARLLETIGVEDRGAFYDGVGALRDVGQNHLLQMLALVTMDQPAATTAEAIRTARCEAIRRLRRLTVDEAAGSTYRAQHEGYREIAGVAPDSATETYFMLATELLGERWHGVPVTMQAGKRLGAVAKDITVRYRHPQPCLCDTDEHPRNEVVFSLEPTESIRMRFWAKRPGFERGVEPREFVFMLHGEGEEGDGGRRQYVEEYAQLLCDCIEGDQTLFVSTDEVRAMWEFVDPVLRAWAEDGVPMASYAPEAEVAAVSGAASAAVAPPGSAMRREVAVIGLGKMGANLARQLHDDGWRVVAYNRTAAKTDALVDEGIEGTYTLAELVARLDPPRVLWLMLTAGDAFDRLVFGADGLLSLLEPGDTVIDGANSFYRDTVARAPRFEGTGVAFVDVGVSGGPGGALRGACLMVGGRHEDFARLEGLWRDASVPGGYRFFEGHGAGHFVKMVHNGVEYGMMQAIAEGFTIMRAADYSLDLSQVGELYQHGSVVESRLVGWLRDGFRLHGVDLADVAGRVGRTGEGEWTVRTAHDLGLEARVIEYALQFRVESESSPSYTGKLLSAMREQFGGHIANVE